MHIPKSAGDSMYRALVATLKPEDVFERGINYLVCRPASHLDVRLTWIGHEIRIPGFLTLAAHKQRHPGCMAITFVRDPYDRLVSAFHYLGAGGRNPRDAADQARYLARYGGNFRKFVKEALACKSPSVFGQLHLRPQYQWLTDDNGALCVDHIGRFENLAADRSLLEERFGLRISSIPSGNASAHAPYWEYYDSQTRDIVYEAYRQDFEFFGYRRELLE